jgi:hypothetical protein
MAISFGSVFDATGLGQDQINGDIVILPGGLLLIDQASPLAELSELGPAISGPIICESEAP